MKIVRSIQMLETSSGDVQFKARAPGPMQSATSSKAAPATGALGVRTAKKVIQERDVSKSSEEVAKSVDPGAEERIKNAETALDDSSGSAQATGANVVSDVVGRSSLIDVMSGIIARPNPDRHDTLRLDIYRDMYYYDATCGSAIDLLSTIPFSDFSLTGLKDEKMTTTFLSSIESMNCATLLPNISIDYNMLGAAVLSAKWDENSKSFRGVTPQLLDYCEFTQIPVFGVDPSIIVRIPEQMLKALNDPELLKKYEEYIPAELINAVKGDNKSKSSGKSSGIGIPLQPETTIFIPRRASLRDYSGVSLLQRALPAWFYEKALIRGTIDQVYKRQRATTHITVEGTEDWVPTQEEMNVIAQMFLNADIDPLGAIVVTRNGVNVNEVRRGDDFWRWDQNYDQIEKIKLRALGISDQFITGDANYSTMEQSLSVFMEGVRDYRTRITREMFYEKIFPTISHAHGYTRKRYGGRGRELASYGNSGISYDRQNNLIVTIGSDMPVYREMASSPGLNINPSDYVVPQVQWHKRLMPEADDAYMAVLTLAEEKGVPVSMRHWVAASGFSVDSLLDGFDEDLELRTKILEYKQELTEIQKEFGVQEPPPGGEGGEGGEEEAEEFANYMVARKFGKTHRRSILSRANPDLPEAEIADFDSQGKRRVMTRTGRQFKLNKYNKVIANVAAELGRIENARNKEEYRSIEKSTKIYT